MYSDSYASITARYPSEAEAVNKLRELFTAPDSREYSFDRLIVLASPHSIEALALILAELTSKKALKQVVRVESQPSSGGIADFPSIQAVPPTIYDWRTDQDISVTPDRLRFLFSVAD